MVGGANSRVYCGSRLLRIRRYNYHMFDLIPGSRPSRAPDESGSSLEVQLGTFLRELLAVPLFLNICLSGSNPISSH